MLVFVELEFQMFPDAAGVEMFEFNALVLSNEDIDLCKNCPCRVSCGLFSEIDMLLPLLV